MGIDPNNPPNTLTPEAVAAIKAATTGGYYANMGNTALSQFAGITGVEPFGLDRNSFDNPNFLWPKNSYTDITGTEHLVQRGYMRSLLTDPSFAGNEGVKNRRLFFQFNPESLGRSVNQTPGAMNPLLQDPAQLTQAIPGTASFAFKLMFNREHEVAAGYNDPNADWLKLPSGRQALVAEVGVLADLLVLDTITGQGLSEDVIDAVARRSNASELRLEQDYLDKKAKAQTASGEDFNEFEFNNTYEPIEAMSTQDISDIYRKNLGNSAFLNALPFRVMFSSLFMVEGIAQSIDVTFQKFSKNMVPTQCVVVINMYALYIGFAKKNTFLYDNLSQAAEIQETTNDANDKVITHLNTALKKISITEAWFKGDLLGSNHAEKARLRINLDKTDVFTKQLSDKIIKNVKVKVSAQYKFEELSTTEPIDDILKANVAVYTLDGVIDIPLDKLTSGAYLESEELGNLINENQDTPALEYLNYRFLVEVTGEGENGNTVSGPIMSFNAVYGQTYDDNTLPNQTWTNPIKQGNK